MLRPPTPENDPGQLTAIAVEHCRAKYREHMAHAVAALVAAFEVDPPDVSAALDHFTKAAAYLAVIQFAERLSTNPDGDLTVARAEYVK